MNHKTAALGALLCAASVELGAFGAHLIADHVSAERLATWHTATRYLGTQGLGVLLLSLAKQEMKLPVTLLISGTLVFCSALLLIVLTNTSWLGAIAPIGGLLMIGGWLTAAFKFYRCESPENSK